jgi:S1-C subfamily serine protease
VEKGAQRSLKSRPSQEVIERMEQNLVFVVSTPSFTDTRKGLFCGSGFFIDNRYILTNNHVAVEGGGRLYVINKTLGFTSEVTVRARDNSGGRDYALLEIGLHRLPLRPLKFSQNLTLGAMVYAWGYPGMVLASQEFDITNHEPPEVVFSAGEIKNVDVNNHPLEIRHEALIFPGNSGGPLVNERGDVLGINSGIYHPNVRRVKNEFMALKSSDIVSFLKAKGYPFMLNE